MDKKRTLSRRSTPKPFNPEDGESSSSVVDEAGQLPLAQLAGAARSAQSVVLLGDQMQLPAPSEGHHPGESGASCLEYLLRGAETVPPSMGIFLPTTFRMHPELCELVSGLSYRGLLRPHPSAAARVVELSASPPSPPAATAAEGAAAAAASATAAACAPRGPRVPTVVDGRVAIAPPGLPEVSAVRGGCCWW